MCDILYIIFGIDRYLEDVPKDFNPFSSNTHLKELVETDKETIGEKEIRGFKGRTRFHLGSASQYEVIKASFKIFDRDKNGHTVFIKSEKLSNAQTVYVQMP